MKCFYRALLFALPVLVLFAMCGVFASLAEAELQQAKAGAAAQAEEPESPPGYEKEYEAWENSEKETDLLKRGMMTIAAIKEFPKSTLIPNFEASFRRTLVECSTNKKYQELETLSEEWLKLHPNDFEAIARIAEAAAKLGHDDKYVLRIGELYKMKPTADLANDMAQTYKRMNNKAKYLEWAETSLKHPEYDSNFLLRLELVQSYWEAKNPAKAEEFARAAMKAADSVKEPSKETQAQLTEVRRACLDLIAKILYDQNKFAEAIKDFRQALKTKEYCEAYYYVGLCLHAQHNADDAMLWYAKASLCCETAGQQCGETGSKAKDNLEKVFKSLHDGKTIGIDKQYRYAREKAASFWIAAN